MAETLRTMIADFLEHHSIKTYTFIHRKKHPAVVIMLNGKKYIHCFPGTPSDHRSAMNCISDLRRRLGFSGATKPKPANCNNKPKRMKKRAEGYQLRFSSPPRAAEDKFYAPLAELKAAMLLQVANDIGAEQRSPTNSGNYALSAETDSREEK